ncbi:MAG: NAD(P)-dependent oxidoreductase, partial [Chloroflexi bacterium]|nr:NAD(P)-dependent oxidoreductase [Chloroflexota bacterium]
MRIAVLGLGNMGRAAATRLLGKGYEVGVWNRSPDKAAELVERGAAEAPTVAEAVAGSDVVLTLLANDAAVKEVCLGEGNALAHLGPGAVLADMSTVHPDTSRALAAAASGGRFVEAPILGGPEAFASGKARLLLGGPEGVVHGLGRLWSDLAAASVYTGPNGTAATLKLLSNLILVGSTELLMEAVVTAQASGIDDGTLREVFGQSPAVAPGVQARLEDILGGDHRGWWTLELADKDMTLV